MIYGDYWIGTADRIPGVCFVQTRFLHVMFVPLIPRESSLFLEGRSEPTAAARIPMCWNSAMLGWLRGFLGFLAAMTFFVLGAVVEAGGSAKAITLTVVGILAVEAILYGLYRVTLLATPAGSARALELMQLLGIREPTGRSQPAPPNQSGSDQIMQGFDSMCGPR